jgi:hypothetical protein
MNQYEMFLLQTSTSMHWKPTEYEKYDIENNQLSINFFVELTPNFLHPIFP